MASKPLNHSTNFTPEWWTVRRRRDYYIGEDGCVYLRLGSSTGIKLAEKLRQVAAIALENKNEYKWRQ